MFTGIVQCLGTVRRLTKVGTGARLVIDAGRLRGRQRPGDSIAVDGVCLTIVRRVGRLLSFDTVAETLRRSTLGRRVVGDRVNLEPAVRVGDPLGGHYVQGHVDGVGRVRSVRPVGGGSVEMTITGAPALTRLCVEKGSIALDGVSLTIARLSGRHVTIALIPTTLEVTTLGFRRPGDAVNVEIDMIGKYVARLVGRP